MTIEELHAICEANGLAMGQPELALLSRYAELLREWNARINLVSRKDEENILSRHILHSLTLRMPPICDFDFGNKRTVDVGTGGGLPGIPLRIITPSCEIVLIDSIQKKVGACNDMIASLGLRKTRAIVGRAEELAKQSEHMHRYDAIISRAVAPLDDLVHWCSGLLESGATLFSLKGGDLTDEVGRSRKIHNVEEVETRPLRLTGYDEFEREEKQLVRVKFREE
jgi:16S rRNA (guanine527-N7)-methyltransferase